MIPSDSFATLAFADELAARPGLAAAYASRFTPDDQATLVVYSADLTPAGLAALIEPVLASVGLDGPGAADVLGVAMPGAEVQTMLAGRAHAVLSADRRGGDFSTLPAFDESNADDLRLLAEATWGRRPSAPTPAEALYSTFMAAGDLVFDIGANTGNRTDTFLALGARVVAVEPQAEIAQQLRSRCDGHPDLTIVECALSDREGVADMLISDAHTLSTLEPGWVEAMRASGRFGPHDWGQTRRVPTRTLTSLIEEFGEPSFCKIDVEGFERTVLAGLDRPVAACSLEFARERLTATGACLDRLASLGPVECNFSEGESLELALPDWVGVGEVMAEIAALAEELAWGDVYVRTPLT